MSERVSLTQVMNVNIVNVFTSDYTVCVWHLRAHHTLHCYNSTGVTVITLSTLVLSVSTMVLEEGVMDTR